MRIEKASSNKKQFLDLLLLADEQEDMIEKHCNVPAIPGQRIWQGFDSFHCRLL